MKAEQLEQSIEEKIIEQDYLVQLEQLKLQEIQKQISSLLIKPPLMGIFFQFSNLWPRRI